MTPKQPIERAAAHHEVMAILGKPKPGPKAKKQANPPIDKEAYLLRRYGIVSVNPYCRCGCGKDGSDLHHAFIGRKKGCPVLDDDRNLVLVNHNEHIARKFDTRDYRIRFWKMQCAFYGQPAMMEWVNSLPEKMRDRIDWL